MWTGTAGYALWYGDPVVTMTNLAFVEAKRISVH